MERIYLSDKIKGKAREAMLSARDRVINDRSEVDSYMKSEIEEIIGYFEKYDNIQLLGGVSLYSLRNTPTIENLAFESNKELDEEAEVIQEYAQSFATAVLNNSKENPPSEVVERLIVLLKDLKHSYTIIEEVENLKPDTSDDEILTALSIPQTLNVRGDAYMQFWQEIFEGLFKPYTVFFNNYYGFTFEQLKDLLFGLDIKIYSKLGNTTGAYLSHRRFQRWCDLYDKEYKEGDEFFMTKFLRKNPDLAGGMDNPVHLLLYQDDDYANSDYIFWVIPENEVEERIFNSLSVNWGDNNKFIKKGEFRGHILNDTLIYQKPFIKDGNKFYLFSSLLVYRNAYSIAENLIKRHPKYYQDNFLDNTHPWARDCFMERKTKKQFEIFMANVHFYPSVTYCYNDNGSIKNEETDIIGISENDIYIIEVKAHELTNKDKRGIRGLKTKFTDSVGYGSYQAWRAADYIKTSKEPKMYSNGALIKDKIKGKEIHKIVVTFQHYYSLVGDMDELIRTGLLKEEYRDTWIVSLFDLMVVSDFTKGETNFLNYLKLRMAINNKHARFIDEIDVYGMYLYHGLTADTLKDGDMIVDGCQEIDDGYNSDLIEPIPIN